MNTPKEPPKRTAPPPSQPLPSNLKAWEDLTIADDYMFKLVMKHKHICKHLLEIILRVKIREIKEPETEKAMKNGFESRGIRLDVFVEDDENTVYDVEMQVRQYPMATLGRRTRYYQSVIDFDALQAGVYYNKLKKSIIIFICPFRLFNSDRHLFTFKNICQQDKKIILDDGASKIFLSTKGTLKDVSKEVRNFLDFVDGLPVKDKWVDEIQELITELKNTEKEKVDYMTYQMKIIEEREEAKAEGRAEERNDAILSLIAAFKDLSASPAQAVEQLIKRYSLTKEEAQAAVQSNW